VTLEELTRPDPAREEAECAARELARALERLGVPLDDLEIIAPCPTCRRTGYSISLGTLHPDQAREMAHALHHLDSSQPTEERAMGGGAFTLPASREGGPENA
jgi:hypothetical protein